MKLFMCSTNEQASFDQAFRWLELFLKDMQSTSSWLFFLSCFFFFVFPLCYFLLLLFVPRRDAEDIKELYDIEFISRVQSEVRKRLTERKKRREWSRRRRRTTEQAYVCDVRILAYHVFHYHLYHKSQKSRNQFVPSCTKPFFSV